MNNPEPTQGEKMADQASKASLRVEDVSRTAHFLGASPQAAHTNAEMCADMAAKAADQLKSEGR